MYFPSKDLSGNIYLAYGTLSIKRRVEEKEINLTRYIKKQFKYSFIHVVMIKYISIKPVSLCSPNMRRLLKDHLVIWLEYGTGDNSEIMYPKTCIQTNVTFISTGRMERFYHLQNTWESRGMLSCMT